MRNYKETVKCPDELAEIIEMVNSLPLNADEVLAISDKRLYMKSAEFFVALKSLVGRKIAEYCLRENSPDLTRYEDLLKAKSLFFHFAEINEQFPDLSKTKEFTQKLVKNFYTVDRKKREFPTRVALTMDCYVKPYKTALLEIFEFYQIPIYRIRKCPKCKKIYWAKRTDSKTCGEKQCVEIQGGKNYHNKNKDEINRKKREAYYKKNKIAFCSKCIHPLSTHGESNCQQGENNNGTL